MSGPTINIDLKPEVLAEFGAWVVVAPNGELALMPKPRARWIAVLRRCLGRPIRVIIAREKTRRSNPQNRYLWGVVYQDILWQMKERAEEGGGDTPFADDDDVHEWAKWKFLRRLRVFPGGEEEEVQGSTKKLSIEEFSAYVNALSAWAAERGMHVRSAEEAA